jgi:hypothetical protein
MAYFADGTFMGDWFGPAGYSRVVPVLRDSRLLHRERALGADHLLIWRRDGLANARLPADDFFRRHFKVLHVSGPIALFEIID